MGFLALLELLSCYPCSTVFRNLLSWLVVLFSDPLCSSFGDGTLTLTLKVVFGKGENSAKEASAQHYMERQWWPLSSGSRAVPLCQGDMRWSSQMLRSRPLSHAELLCCCFWACGAPWWSWQCFHLVVFRWSLGCWSSWTLETMWSLHELEGSRTPVVGPLFLEQLSWWLRE